MKNLSSLALQEAQDVKKERQRETETETETERERETERETETERERERERRGLQNRNKFTECAVKHTTRKCPKIGGRVRESMHVVVVSPWADS